MVRSQSDVPADLPAAPIVRYGRAHARRRRPAEQGRPMTRSCLPHSRRRLAYISYSCSTQKSNCEAAVKDETFFSLFFFPVHPLPRYCLHTCAHYSEIGFCRRERRSGRNFLDKRRAAGEERVYNGEGLWLGKQGENSRVQDDADIKALYTVYSVRADNSSRLAGGSRSSFVSLSPELLILSRKAPHSRHLVGLKRPLWPDLD